MSKLLDELQKIVPETSHQGEEMVHRFLERLPQEQLTRDENKQSHVCVYFLPFNPVTKEVFVVHHKKADLWIAPGGHVDAGEGIMDAVNREMEEELGLVNFFKDFPKPFFLSITPINTATQPCKEHLDVWVLVPTDGKDFNVDPSEFHDTKWLSIPNALKLVTEKANRDALQIVTAIR